ncbi:glycosyltransferase family 4 protein [Catenovulum sp. SM1970]|uniref:glycosyltransferase family 4 protein n=1 Tax=Marinifaba aquimaris TaxID=2741323 RepID=UPI00157171E4|nr:glycosyltransferase family 4 protein [Marinifaba aquimaris]NTS76901.1 glycosyltransferase family 4 protein [Marinifaba aquimaris]
MTQNKDVILLTSNLYRPHFGGVENSLYHLSQAYKKQGKWPVIVVSDISPDNSKLADVEEIDGITIYRYSMTKPYYLGKVRLPKVISGILNSLSLYKKVIQKYQPELIITRYHFNQLFCKWAGGKNTVYLVPGVVKFQNASKNVSSYSLKRYLRWYYHYLLQFFALKSSDQLAVFSHNMIKQVNSVINPKKELLLTKPGVDGHRFYPLPKEQKNLERNALGLNCKGHVFLCVGRCVAAKGFDLAINAFRSQTGTDNQLWIVGDGPLLDNYKYLVEQLGLEGQVKFIGSTLEPEKYYRAADTFLMSSIYEPLGQTILEALSSGLPVIAFEPSNDVNTASREILNSNCALFVNQANSDELANSIERILDLSPDELSEKSAMARIHAEDHFSWNNLANDLLEVFNNEK